jgi:serine phosphatase RsbU (regulator of sigma subunit)
MIIALFSEDEESAAVSARLESDGHACILASDSIPGEADCVIVVGGARRREGLIAAAEEAGLPVLRIPASGAAESARAAAWGLGLADERYIDAARSDARVKRLEDVRVRMAEQRALELTAANELLQKQARDLREALERLDGANRQLVQELNLASELQKSLLPRSYPSDLPLEFAQKFMPLHSIGGDFFDVVRLDDKSVAMVIADVSGHGVGPALVAAMFKSAFGLRCRAVRSPAALMSELNSGLTAALTGGYYVTAFAAFIDAESLELRYCSAGHPNQILLRADGRAEELATMGFLLGMIDGVDYEEKTAVLQPGDSLVLFTDGVFESPDAEGRPFGREGIIREAAPRVGYGASGITDGVLSGLLSWTEGTEASDDVTLLVAQAIESL